MSRLAKTTAALRAFSQGLSARTIGPERAAARARISARLPSDIQRPDQWFGTHTVGCFATHNIYEACNFSCTACYLSKEANQTPPLSFDRVKAQLDAIRAFGGPGANTQITAGEVTLLPIDDLCRIVRYARDIGLDPMVMSNGQVIDDDPSYLRALVEHAGLEKISIHIDTTQRGRKGVDRSASETDLHAVRDRFADVVRDVRRSTGKRLYAAQTATLTQDNIDEVPSIIGWLLRNTDAFRMIGLLPTADVGRTRVREATRRTDRIWKNVARGMGLDEVNPNPVIIGDPRCNQIGLFWAVRFGDEYKAIEIARKDKPIDTRFMRALFSGAFSGYTSDGLDGAALAGSLVGTFLRSPKYLWQWPAYAAYRLFPHAPWLPRFVRAVALRRPVWIRPLVVICHNFMSSRDLETPEGRKRLSSCMFRLPVDGKMVSMCEMNGTDLRAETNRAVRQGLVQIAPLDPSRPAPPARAP